MIAPVVASYEYRQRIALPPGAVVRVALSDVSVADAPSTTVAEQVITPEHQVPIPLSARTPPEHARSCYGRRVT